MQENDHVREILNRQTLALEKIERHFAPAEMEQQERRWRIFIAKMVALGSIMVSGLFGGWECILFLKQQWDIRHMAARYAQVAEEIYYNENNAEVASEFLAKAIELEENKASYRYLQAYIEGMGVVRELMNLDRPLMKEEVDKAHEAVARAVLLKRLSSARPEPYILQGQVYAALGENGRAFDELNEAIRLDPRNDFAHVRLAVLLASEEKVDDALQEIGRALELNAKSKWAYLWRGVVLADHRKDWDGARAAYAKAMELDPRFDLAYYNLGWTYLKQEPVDYGQARAQFEKAMTLNPNFKEAYYGMGMVYGYQNQYEIAQLYFTKAIDLDDKFLTAWKWRAIVHAEQNRPLAALNDFTKAIELAPIQPDLYVRRARAYEKLEQVDKAVADLRFAAELDPKDKQIWLYLGDVYLNVNEVDMAIANYEKALQLDPGYSEAHAQAAEAYVKKKDAAAAEKSFERAIATATYRPERFLMKRADFYAQEGRLEDALKGYRAARDASPEMAEAWMAEAKTLQAMHRNDEALAALEKYVELRPMDKSAQELRATFAPTAVPANGATQ